MAAKVSESDKKIYQTMYNSFDQDGDGKIDFSEFDELVKAAKGESYPGDMLRDIFEKCDKDGNNRIDFDEFLNIAPELPPVADTYMAEFKKIDADDNNVLTKEEIQYAIMTIGGKFINSKKVQEKIDKVDVNKDGKINYAEFLNLIPDLYT